MKLISLLLSIVTFLTAFVMPSYEASVPELTDDDFVPVLRFVATSDTHINTLGDTGCKRTSAMIKTAYAISEADRDYKNLDAVVFSGDVTDNGLLGSFLAFTAVTDKEIREGTERLAVIAKNHDSYTYQRKAPKLFTEITGQEADFHRVIGGFHFIGISRSPDAKHYSEAQVEWLDKNLAEAVKDDQAKPVFVFQHEHVRDTVYGSSKSDGWGLDVFSDVLKKYPQAVHISGHSHFPANDPRAVWQDSFTAINDGGLAYYELAVDGKNGQFPEEKDRMSQALIIEVDADNRVLVKVLDVDECKIVKEFLIDNIAEEKKEKFNPDVRKAKSSVPVFAEGASLKAEQKKGMLYITVPQAQVSGDNEVFLYRISVFDKNGKAVHEDWEFSQYFFADRPDSITFKGFMSVKSDLTVKVCAEDVWGNRSEYLEIKI